MSRDTLVIAIGFLAVACSESGQPMSAAEADISKPAQTYVKMATLTVDALNNLYDIVEDTVETSPDAKLVVGRVVGHKAVSDLTLDELEQVLTITLDKGAELSFRRHDTTALEEAVEAVVADFEQKVSESAPDTTLAATVDGVQAVEGGLVVDDRFINPKTLKGAFEVELLNSMALGVQIEDALEELNNVETDLVISPSKEESAGRYVYLKSTDGWDKREVVYKYDSTLYERHKLALKAAMKAWSDKTGGLVKFINYDDKGAGYRVMVRLGTRGLLTLKTANLKNADGDSIVGENVGTLRIDKNIEAPAQMMRVSIHELGHALGLQHEHQHWDRDNWVKVSAATVKSDPVNFGILTEYVQTRTLKWEWSHSSVYMKSFERTATEHYNDKPSRAFVLAHPEPKWNVVTYDYTRTKEFDCRSVMLYDLRLKKDCGGYKAGNLTTNFDISAGDVEGVKSLYR